MLKKIVSVQRVSAQSGVERPGGLGEPPRGETEGGRWQSCVKVFQNHVHAGQGLRPSRGEAHWDVTGLRGDRSRRHPG